jgi:hypothetical protein
MKSVHFIGSYYIGINIVYTNILIAPKLNQTFFDLSRSRSAV